MKKTMVNPPDRVHIRVSLIYFIGRRLQNLRRKGERNGYNE